MLLTAKLFSAGCHSHKELFHEGGRKKKMLVTDKQRRENTNHGDNYTTTETAESRTTRETREKHSFVLKNLQQQLVGFQSREMWPEHFFF